LNSLGVGKQPGKSSSSCSPSNNNSSLVPAEWKVDGMTCCSSKKLEVIFSNSGLQPEMLEVDKEKGSVRALVATLSHAEQLTRDMSFAGFSANLERINNQEYNQPVNNLTKLTLTLDEEPPQEQVYERLIAKSKLPKNNNKSNLHVVEMAVGGMTCSMCSNAVQKHVKDIPGVASVSVSLSTNTARIEYEESDACNPEMLKEEIEDIGYTVDDVIIERKPPPASTISSTLKVVEFAVGGMTCSMCSNAVTKALMEIPGVKEVDVSLATTIARVKYEESLECDAALLQEEIEDIGYDVNDVMHQQEEGQQDQSQTTDDPEGRLQRLLRQQDAHLTHQRLAFYWSLIGTLPVLTITMIIPHVFSDSHPIRKCLEQHVTLFGHSFILEALVLWVLATPVQFGSGFGFYRSSYYNIFVQGMLGMDVLVVLGTTASYGYAVIATWTGDAEYHFFETSAVLICFVLLGKWMNALAIRRTSEALTQLMNLQAKTALKVTPSKKIVNGEWNPLHDSYDEELVPINSVHPGDIVKVLKGASIPADGILSYGEMSVDESMITGESLPVLKTPGSIVLGGTICAETGSGSMEANDVTAAAFIQVTGVGSSTALSQIVKLVQDAQSRQVPIQNLADKISSIFVPVVVTISLLSFMVWYALCNCGAVPSDWYEGESPLTFSLMFGIACLVISCPCALGLATPTAVMVGTGMGAKLGVLMKGGETLELASKVDSVVFDKTGTLTRGKPAITTFDRMVPDSFLTATIQNGANGNSVLDGYFLSSLDDYLLWLLGSLERNSEHPLATAVVTYAEGRLNASSLKEKSFAQPTNFRALTGRGASGTINGNIEVSIGNRAFATLMDIPIPDKAEQCMQSLERHGNTAILASVNGTVCAVIGIADQLKDDASASISYLRNMGVDVWMVTGDNRRTANAIARQLNLPQNRVISEALPVAKLEQVIKLQSQGRVVAMVGDGVNDSPALAESDVGMSMGTGAEIAAEASDMVLVRGHVADVCTALNLSRTIFRRIQVSGAITSRSF
jgi:Cu+-exporting ATPase